MSSKSSSKRSSSKSRRGGGRVTAKGTQPAKKPTVGRNTPPAAPDPFDERISGKVHRAHGRPARPITHNRGNR